MLDSIDYFLKVSWKDEIWELSVTYNCHWIPVCFYCDFVIFLRLSSLLWLLDLHWTGAWLPTSSFGVFSVSRTINPHICISLSLLATRVPQSFGVVIRPTSRYSYDVFTLKTFPNIYTILKKNSWSLLSRFSAASCVVEVGNFSREWPAGSLFNSCYTEV